MTDSKDIDNRSAETGNLPVPAHRQSQTRSIREATALGTAVVTEDVPISPAPTAAAATQALSLLLSDHRSENTKRAYQADLRDFFAWRDEPVAPPSVEALCRLDQSSLALLLNGYKAHLRERHLSEATVNRRLAAVRSLLRMARRLGAAIPDPSGLVSSEKVSAYRDTRGPELAAAARLLSAPDRSTLRGKRDFALLVLLCENALRRGELAACNVADFDPAQKRLYIKGKGRGTQMEPVTLSEVAVAALADYLQALQGDPVLNDLAPGEPLFVSCGRGSRAVDGRLTGRGLLHVVNGYGRRVLGRDLHPHALRHMAITAVSDATGGDVRTAQRLSRHADLRTLQRYDDNREDLQGRATLLLSRLLAEKR